MSQNIPICTEQQEKQREINEVAEIFERLISQHVGACKLPGGTDNFTINQHGEYVNALTLVLWQFFQLGYAARMKKAIELPKEVNGTLIEHMPKGSGFKTGFDFLIKDLLKKGVNLV